MENINTNRLIIFTTFFVLLIIVTIFNVTHKNITYDKPPILSKINTTYSRSHLKDLKIQMDKDTMQQNINMFTDSIIQMAKSGETFYDKQIKLLFANNIEDAIIKCNEIKMYVYGIFFDSKVSSNVIKTIKYRNKNNNGRPTLPPSKRILYVYYCKISVEWD
jgi:hypothetical protein